MMMFSNMRYETILWVSKYYFIADEDTVPFRVQIQRVIQKDQFFKAKSP